MKPRLSAPRGQRWKIGEGAGRAPRGHQVLRRLQRRPCPREPAPHHPEPALGSEPEQRVDLWRRHRSNQAHLALVAGERVGVVPRVRARVRRDQHEAEAVGLAHRKCRRVMLDRGVKCKDLRRTPARSRLPPRRASTSTGYGFSPNASSTSSGFCTRSGDQGWNLLSRADWTRTSPTACTVPRGAAWGSGRQTDSGARSEQTQGPALGAPAPEGAPNDLGYLEHRRRICASSRL